MAEEKKKPEGQKEVEDKEKVETKDKEAQAKNEGGSEAKEQKEAVAEEKKEVKDVPKDTEDKQPGPAEVSKEEKKEVKDVPRDTEDKQPDSAEASEEEKKEVPTIELPDIKVGNSIKVHFSIIEGKRKRIQVFEGVVLAIKGKGKNKSISVRKISFGIGVERTFPLNSPKISKIDIVKTGKTRRSKLYFLRGKKSKKSMRLKSVSGK